LYEARKGKLRGKFAATTPDRLSLLVPLARKADGVAGYLIWSLFAVSFFDCHPGLGKLGEVFGDGMAGGGGDFGLVAKFGG